MRGCAAAFPRSSTCLRHKQHTWYCSCALLVSIQYTEYSTLSTVLEYSSAEASNLNNHNGARQQPAFNVMFCTKFKSICVKFNMQIFDWMHQAMKQSTRMTIWIKNALLNRNSLLIIMNDRSFKLCVNSVYVRVCVYCTQGCRKFQCTIFRLTMDFDCITIKKNVIMFQKFC